MLTRPQSNQIILEIILSELANASKEQLDSILTKINDSLKIPGMFTCSGGIVTVQSTTLAKPNGRNFVLNLGNTEFNGLSGTFNFNANINTGDIQAATVPSMIDGEFCKAVFEIRSDKKIYILFGNVAASANLALLPNLSSEGLCLGYVLLNKISGNFNLTNDSLFQFNAYGILQNHNSLSNRSDANQHPSASISTNTGNFSGALGSNEDEVQKALERIEKYAYVFNWETSKSYRIGNLVKNDRSLYRCITAHISTTFIADLVNWELAEDVAIEEIQTVTGSPQTVFTLTTISIPPERNKLMVFVNGVYQNQVIHYVINDDTEVEFNEPISINASVTFRVN